VSDTCPECGADWVQSGMYCNVAGELSSKTPLEVSDEYHQQPDKYDGRFCTKYECGNVVIKE